MKQTLPKGASYELRCEHTQTSSAKFEGNRFESIESADRTSQTVRLQHEGKLSTASGTKPENKDALIAQAAAIVRYGSPHEVPFVGETKIASMNLTDETTLTSKQMIELLSGLVADLQSMDKNLIVSAGISSSLSEISLQTSPGFNHSYRKSFWHCSCAIELMQGEDLLTLYESQVELGPNFNLKQLRDGIERKLNYARNVVPFKAGTYPVIFTPYEVNNIINPVLASLNGLAVYRQMSAWGDKLGQELLDPRFTLIDDGTQDGAWTSKPFDFEGTPTKRNVLVQNGRPNALLLDRKVAAQLNKESSGNAGGGALSTHHLILAPGNKTLDELISSIDYGLLIDGTMGSWSGNPYTGVVSGTISMGLKIEKGKIAGRVKDCMFTINAFEHLKKHIVDFSSETKALSNIFPYMMLNEVVISTK